MAMRLIKKTPDYKIFVRGDDRYAVQDANGKPVNGEEKVRILLAEELITVAIPDPAARGGSRPRMMTVGPNAAAESTEEPVEEAQDATSDEAEAEPEPNRSQSLKRSLSQNLNPKRLPKRRRLTATMKKRKRKRKSKAWRLPCKDIKPACAGFFMRCIALSFAQSNQNLPESYGP